MLPQVLLMNIMPQYSYHKIQTMDPTTWIVEQTTNYVVYENTDGRKWRLDGICNACGLCEPKIGAVGETVVLNNYIVVDGIKQKYTRKLLWKKQAGEPNACEEENYNLRSDIPITPDFVNELSGCSLNGVWLA